IPPRQKGQVSGRIVVCGDGDVNEFRRKRERPKPSLYTAPHPSVGGLAAGVVNLELQHRNTPGLRRQSTCKGGGADVSSTGSTVEPMAREVTANASDVLVQVEEIPDM